MKKLQDLLKDHSQIIHDLETMRRTVEDAKSKRRPMMNGKVYDPCTPEMLKNYQALKTKATKSCTKIEQCINKELTRGSHNKKDRVEISLTSPYLRELTRS